MEDAKEHSCHAGPGADARARAGSYLLLVRRWPIPLLGVLFQMVMAVVSFTLAIRNSSGQYTLPDLDNQPRTATNLASELGLHQEQGVFERALFPGQRLSKLAEDDDGDHGVLFTFTQKLPNAPGLAQRVLQQDIKDLKAIPCRGCGYPGFPSPPADPPARGSVPFPLPGGGTCSAQRSAGRKGKKGGTPEYVPAFRVSSPNCTGFVGVMEIIV